VFKRGKSNSPSDIKGRKKKNRKSFRGGHPYRKKALKRKKAGREKREGEGRI